MSRRLARSLRFVGAFAAAIPGLGGCGDDWGDDATLELTKFQIELPGSTPHEGIVRSDGLVCFYGEDGGLCQPDPDPLSADCPAPDRVRVGDNQDDSAIRGFFSFDLVLPAGADIVSATLNFTPLQYESQSVDVPPPPLFNYLGNLVADHVDIGDCLEAGDFGSVPLQGSVLTLLSTEVPVGQQVPVSVTAAVVDDLANGRPRSTFRLRFVLPTDGDGEKDFVELGASSGGLPADAPVLIIEYTVP